MVARFYSERVQTRGILDMVQHHSHQFVLGYLCIMCVVTFNILEAIASRYLSVVQS